MFLAMTPVTLIKTTAWKRTAAKRQVDKSLSAQCIETSPTAHLVAEGYCRDILEQQPYFWL